MNSGSLFHRDVSVGAVELSLMRLSVRGVGPIIEAQYGELTCSIQVRTTLEQAHRVFERQGHESEVPFEKVQVARGRGSRI